MKPPGYLCWVKIDCDLLDNDHLEEDLERCSALSTDSYLKQLYKYKLDVVETCEILSRRGIECVRTGISWAEWINKGGKTWVKWYMAKLSQYFDVLPCLSYTPPQLAEPPSIYTNTPPKELWRYAQFVLEVIDTFDLTIKEVELWNEWDIVTDWNSAHDPHYLKFMTMITLAAHCAHSRGKKVILGGMSKVKKSLQRVREFSSYGFFNEIDVVGIHNLRGTWSDTTPPPTVPEQIEMLKIAMDEKIIAERNTQLQRGLTNNIHQATEYVRSAVLKNTCRPASTRAQKTKPIWLTEYGFPPHDPHGIVPSEPLEEIQVHLFAYAISLINDNHTERVYWYTHKDKVTPSVRYVTTGWEDVLQYYFGDTKEDGKPKLLGLLLNEGGVNNVLKFVGDINISMINRASFKRQQPVNYIPQERPRCNR